MLYHDCLNSMSTISSKYHEYSFCMWLSWLILKLSTNPPLFVLIDMLCNIYGGRQATQLCAPFIPCLYLPLSEWNKIYVMLCYVMLCTRLNIISANTHITFQLALQLPRGSVTPRNEMNMLFLSKVPQIKHERNLVTEALPNAVPTKWHWLICS